MVTQEQVNEILNVEGKEQSEKVKALMDLYDEDFNSQLNAIKAVKEQLKNEKTEEIAKKQAAIKERDELRAENEKLGKQLKDLAPEKVQEVYDQKLQENANMYTAQIEKLNKTIEEQNSKIAEGEKALLKNECMTEFNKAIQGSNIAPDMIEAFSQYVLGVDCANFARRPIGDGKEILATKDGLSIKQAVETAKTSTFGKNCILNTSSGGGAEGGAGSSTTKDNPFISGNITEQMRLFRENKAEYDRLKIAAGK